MTADWFFPLALMLLVFLYVNNAITGSMYCGRKVCVLLLLGLSGSDVVHRFKLLFI